MFDLERPGVWRSTPWYEGARDRAIRDSTLAAACESKCSRALLSVLLTAGTEPEGQGGGRCPFGVRIASFLRAEPLSKTRIAVTFSARIALGTDDRLCLTI